MRLSRARQSVTMARYRASKTWSGSSVWGKKVRSGSGKIGRKILATAKSASADGRQLERREGPQPLGHAIGQRAKSSGLARVGLANHDGDARIARARWHVEDEVVEGAPHDVAQELLDGRVDHRPAPDQGLALGNEEPDGHDLDAVGLDGDDLVVEHAGLAFGAHHDRHIGAVDVHVYQTHGMPLLFERQRQVDS